MDIGNLISDFFTTPGPGGVVVVTVIFLAGAIYVSLTRWILRGGETKDDSWRRRS